MTTYGWMTTATAFSLLADVATAAALLLCFHKEKDYNEKSRGGGFSAFLPSC